MVDPSTDPEQLQANLAEYEEQLEQVGQLLLDDPENDEYKEIFQGLEEVISLTKEVLAATTAKGQPHEAGRAPAAEEHETGAGIPSSHLHGPVAAITEAPEVKVPSVLPPQVAEQIRKAQQRAALTGQAPAEWAIGAKVQGKYSGDGEWYDGEVTGISVNGKFIVKLLQYGVQEELSQEEIRQQPQGVRHGETRMPEYQGVSAPKRKSVEQNPDTLSEPPTWMQIKPSDDEKTKIKKKKLMKSFKSKQRFLKMDLEQKKKADSWKNFMSSKAMKKKGGKKKTSMFSVAEGVESKVGVIGSGKGMTAYSMKKKHEFH